MVSRKRVVDRIERFQARLLDRLRPWAYPGHGVELPPVLMFALMKSGSIFIQRALRRTLEVEVRHIGGSGIGGNWFSYPELCRFSKGNAVSREHIQPRPEYPKVLADFNIRRAVVHVRDPRGAILSWTNQMERQLPLRGLSYVAYSCEQHVPHCYLKWSFEERLRWQIEHVMPRMVDWIEGWLAIADGSKDVTFLVTDYAELARDSRAYIEKLLAFYEVPYEPDWVKIPRREIGRNNVFSVAAEGTSPLQMRPPLHDDILELADAAVPAGLIERFGWTRPAIH
jgi:hypothetical protein